MDVPSVQSQVNQEKTDNDQNDPTCEKCCHVQVLLCAEKLHYDAAHRLGSLGWQGMAGADLL